MIITITGPSGSGKTSIAKTLIEKRPNIRLVVSLTMREPRPSDLPGEYLHNIPREEFEARKEEFAWITPPINGKLYGTLKKSLDEALAATHPSLMILIPEKAAQIREYAENRGRVLSFYVLSPPEDELRQRMRGRGDSESAIEERLKQREAWDKDARNSPIPYIFIANDEPDTGIEKAAEEILKRLRG